MPDFLLEIGCEEIPARMIDAASQELRERIGSLLGRERLAAGEITSFSIRHGGWLLWFREFLLRNLTRLNKSPGPR